MQAHRRLPGVGVGLELVAVHAVEPHAHRLLAVGLLVDERAGDAAAALADPAIKQQLAANGADAIALEIFGVPTMVIDGQLFWGNDASEMALAYLADRSLFDDEQMRRVDSIPAAVQRPGSRA